jgi:hypothetical protein
MIQKYLRNLGRLARACGCLEDQAGPGLERLDDSRLELINRKIGQHNKGVVTAGGKKFKGRRSVAGAVNLGTSPWKEGTPPEEPCWRLAGRKYSRKKAGTFMEKVD